MICFTVGSASLRGLFQRAMLETKVLHTARLHLYSFCVLHSCRFCVFVSLLKARECQDDTVRQDDTARRDGKPASVIVLHISIYAC